MVTSFARGGRRACRTMHLVLAAASLCACAGAPEPGTPPRDPSPLFAGYSSYRTVQDLERQLPEQSAWRVMTRSVAQSRPGCPRFAELTFSVRASDGDHTGELTLMFINDRLLSTTFTPDDFASYARSLEDRGVRLDDHEAAIAPATLVWSRTGPEGRPFVGWRDTRFSRQVDAWIQRCS